MINKQEIGRRFEEEAYKFLKNKYRTVIWNSRSLKKSQIIDFTCSNKIKKYLIEAKSGITKRKILSERQAEKADFVITKINDKIRLIPKKDFNKYFTIGKLSRMIPINDKVWQELNRLKRISNLEHTRDNRISYSRIILDLIKSKEKQKNDETIKQ